MSAIFALANQKGGVAKTTTTGILAAGLKKQGFSVLTIDCDPQGNLSMSVAAENQDSATMYEFMKGTVSAREAIQHTPSCDIIPANTILAGIEQELHNVGKEMTLREKLRDEQTGVAEAYDYILIDCMPSLGMITVNSLTASDRVLVPVQAAYLPVKGLEQLITTIYRVKKHLNPQIQFEGILISMLNARTNYAKDIMELIKKYYGESIPIFESKIPFSVKAAETSAAGVSIFTLDKKHPVAHAYEKLTKEVIAHE